MGVTGGVAEHPLQYLPKSFTTTLGTATVEWESTAMLEQLQTVCEATASPAPSRIFKSLGVP